MVEIAGGIVESVRRYVSDDDCYAILEAERWPKALSCIHCGSNDVRRFNIKGGGVARRTRFQCNGCRYQFSSTTGTIFHHSRVSLLTWFVAIALLNHNPRLSAVRLQKNLQITYKSAWRLRREAYADLLGLDYFGDEKNEADEFGSPTTKALEKRPPRMGRKIVLASMILRFTQRIPDPLRKELVGLAALQKPEKLGL